MPNDPSSHVCIPHQLKAREAEDALRAQEELCRPGGGPPKPPPPGGGGGAAGVSAVAANVARAAINVVDLPPLPAMPPPSYSSANPMLNELTSSPPAINNRSPVRESFYNCTVVVHSGAFPHS